MIRTSGSDNSAASAGKIPDPPPIVLASRSPRRVGLLTDAGYRFDIDPADVDETPTSGLASPQIAEDLARRKALHVLARHPTRAVLGADTIVVLDGQLLGKPDDADHARRMLASLSGQTHEVITGVCVATAADVRVDHAISEVAMKPLTAAEIDAYVASGKWHGKAGGYGIQDETGNDPFVRKLSGDWTNIVGLPMELVRRLLGAISETVAPGRARSSRPPRPLRLPEAPPDIR